MKDLAYYENLSKERDLTEAEAEAGKKAWLASRPPAIRKLAEEFPFGTVLVIQGQDHHLLGYTEDSSRTC